MKIVRFIAAVAMLTTVAIFSASAQQRPAGATTPAATPQSNVAVPDSKLAMIFSDAFMDPKIGIAKFTALAATLEREFQPRQTEINNLQTRIAALTKEINDTQAVAAPETVRQKRDQLEQLNVEIKRKSEDAQNAYGRRRQEIFAPLQRDIGKALEDFAKARGITVIVDGSQVPVSYVADALDVTRVFINEFNSKNPATASVVQP
jgi:Skp family chaperone for outer membrane proteins